MPPFDRLLRMADRTSDRVNAEPFTLTPIVRPANGRPRLDEERAVIRGKGVFDYRAGDAGGIQVGNRSHAPGRNDMKTLVSGRTPTLSFSTAVLDGQEVRQGDRVDLPDWGTGRRFEVTSAQPDGHGRIVLELVER